MTEKKRNKYGLTQRDMTTIQTIFETCPEVKKVYLFGSRAKGNYQLGSDVDLAIMNRGLAPRKLAALKNNFKESSLPYNIDLVDFTRLDHQKFIDHIQRVGVLFFCKGKVLTNEFVDS